MEPSNDQKEPVHAKLISPIWIVVDIILAGIFFFFMFNLMKSFAPGETENTIRILGGITAFCLTLFFWLALQLFRVTLTDQIRNNNDGTPRK